ncbi:hypothetical protein JOC95_001340 [Bacillus tianshenii]|uniref:Uncharacterized protein n=1 Tax=Sutcliffiella tianshenii TaxID=1463404 RepID=A0ABS2NXW6_9BACI|nr:hypothetical protein [Bacillus tianshenii]
MKTILPFEIRVTNVRNQVVFPDQIQIDLHDHFNDELTIVTENSTYTLKDIYSVPAIFFSDLLKGKKEIILHSDLSLDVILPVYIIKKALLDETLPPFSFYLQMSEIIRKVRWESSISNLRVLWEAGKKVNPTFTALEKFTLLISFFEKCHQRGPEKFSNLLERIYLEGVETILYEESDFLMKDFQFYVREESNHQGKTSDNFLVSFEDGTVREIRGKVSRNNPHAHFYHYWLQRDGFSLLIQELKIENEKVCKIVKLDKKINLKNLKRILDHYELEKEWMETGEYLYAESSSQTLTGILSHLKNVTDPWVKRQRAKYVIPFHFDYKRYNKISAYIDNLFLKIDESMIHHKFRDTFLPQFNDYFFNNIGLSNKQIHSEHFKSGGKYFISLQQKDFKILTSQNGEATQHDSREVQVSIRIFQYGVGFIILDSDFIPEEIVPLKYILRNDEIICRNVDYIFRYFIKDNKDLKIDATRRGIVYESIELESESFQHSLKENLILKTCSANKNTYIKDKEELKSEINEKYLSRGDFVFYGFSRSCGVQYLVDNPALSKSGLEKLAQNFMEEKFFVFLFSIQQRDAIRQFSDKLVRGSMLKQKLKTNAIRRDFIEFITQVKLSHISDHNVVTKFYNKWRVIFDSEAIYQEVAEKLSALDGYQQSRVSYHFNFLSFLVFPIIAISSLFTMGIFKTNPIHLELGTVIISCFALLVLFFTLLNKR